MGVTSFQQSLYEFFDSGLLFRIALLQKTILFLLFIEKRYMEGEENPAKVVLIDSKTSFANRAEATTTEAMRNGEGILSKMPHIAVEYDVDDGKNVFMIISFHIVALTAISVSAVTKVSPRPRLNHMRMHEILRWRICFRCLICLRKPSSLVVGIRRVVRIS